MRQECWWEVGERCCNGVGRDGGRGVCASGLGVGGLVCSADCARARVGVGEERCGSRCVEVGFGVRWLYYIDEMVNELSKVGGRGFGNDIVTCRSSF